jgi:UPF0716 family protein affecting phage T7 exclusion
MSKTVEPFSVLELKGLRMERQSLVSGMRWVTVVWILLVMGIGVRFDWLGFFCGVVISLVAFSIGHTLARVQELDQTLQADMELRRER